MQGRIDNIIIITTIKCIYQKENKNDINDNKYDKVYYIYTIKNVSHHIFYFFFKFTLSNNAV